MASTFTLCFAGLIPELSTVTSSSDVASQMSALHKAVASCLNGHILTDVLSSNLVIRHSDLPICVTACQGNDYTRIMTIRMVGLEQKYTEIPNVRADTNRMSRKNKLLVLQKANCDTDEHTNTDGAMNWRQYIATNEKRIYDACTKLWKSIGKIPSTKARVSNTNLSISSSFCKPLSPVERRSKR